MTIAEIVCIWVFKVYIVYLLLEIISVCANIVVVSVIADKYYPFIKQRYELPKKQQKEVFSNTMSMFIYKIARSMITGTDNILISIICGTIYVGLYSNYLSITDGVTAFFVVAFQGLISSVGNLVVTASPQKRYQTFETMQMVAFWICGILCVCLLLLTEDFITLWIGKEYLLDKITLVAIVFNTFFSICMHPVWAFREGTGMYNQIRYIMLFTATLNIILSIILGKMIGIAGILFATSLSKLLTNFWYEPNLLFKNFFSQKPINYYLDYAANMVLMFVCFVVSYYATKWINVDNYALWICKALIVFLVINAVYFARYFRTVQFFDMISHLKNLLRIKKGGG